MPRRKSLTTWLLFVLAGAVLAFLGYRWILSQYYPLKYRESLYQRSQEHGLDPYLVAAVIRRESRFRPNVTSPQGARGLMQIMPDTGEWIAGQLKIPFNPDQLYEPDYNIRLGTWYLAYLKAEFGGVDVLALAAYNGGRNNVLTWLWERRWTGEHHTVDQIPFRETREYVVGVLQDEQWYRRIYAQ